MRDVLSLLDVFFFNIDGNFFFDYLVFSYFKVLLVNNNYLIEGTNTDTSE